ncbi:MAG: bifunctional diaminohydroxyphosphoribosylaminopyrimidine deaminase/5-amino-6-(5-phosphoribosylamino)uracil reductase RibD [Limnohabitans sp.]|nr:bifunctional diaminohydroxyphosphoribosylaminopyrimidine deaminase/5-amino-6-(5-phosphoribosylamino)uracil reductase RibD [Limnohabitans sp.]
MNFSDTDTHWMKQALVLAHQSFFITTPNPRVGCVLVNPQGQLIGQGHTQKAGGDHAEIVAIKNAQSLGHIVKGATAYVTLEPCSHHGKTGPCCDALIQAGVSRVVASIQDPFPQVAGQGFARLRQASIQVDVGLCQPEALQINQGFFYRIQHQLPWMRMKIACSLDGQTALQNGQSQWITSQASRTDGHNWRARACAILTGIGTVLQDDPQLNVRDVQTLRQPPLIIVDSQLQTPLNAKLWQTQRTVLIYHATNANTQQAQALTGKGAQLILLPDAQNKVDLHAMAQDLAKRPFNEIHVEAGFKLNGSLLKAQCVQELLIYMAPVLVGSGAGMAQLGVLEQLTQAQAFHFTESIHLGSDLRIRAQRDTI